jgi:hypothetical protein
VIVSLAVSFPSTFSQLWIATYPQKSPFSELRYPLNVSHILRVFIHPKPAGLISYQSRPWDFPFRVFSHVTVRSLFQDSNPLVVYNSFWLWVYQSLWFHYPRLAAIPQKPIINNPSSIMSCPTSGRNHYMSVFQYTLVK